MSWGSFSSLLSKRRAPLVKACIVLTFMVMLSSSVFAIDPPDSLTKARLWRTRTGANFEAVVVEIGRDNASFEISGVSKDLPLSNLDLSDEALLRVAYFGGIDQRQLDVSKTILYRLADQLNESGNALKLSHLDYSVSPYSGLWASVCLSAGANKNSEAMSMLRQVIDRVDRQREFDSTRHAMTLASAQNNMAVCMIKSQKADAAAGLLALSLELSPIVSPIVVHNMKHLLELGSQQNSVLTLNKNSIRKLRLGLGNVPEQSQSLPMGWLYSLDVDLPNPNLMTTDSTAGMRPPFAGATLAGLTTGLRLSADTLIASSEGLALPSVSNETKFSVSLVLNEEKKTLPALLTESDPQLRLIGLRIQGELLDEVELRLGAQSTNTQVAIFSLATQDSSRLPRTTLAKMIPSDDVAICEVDPPQPLFGPVVDRQANLVGFAHTNGQVTQAVPFTGLQQFANQLGITVPNTAKPSFRGVKAACVLVAAWKPGDDSSEPRYLHQEPSLTDATQSLHISDKWCVNCKGTGVVTCTACQRGSVKTRKRVQVGVNGITGGPIHTIKEFRASCSRCSGRGGFKCNFCNQGRRR